MTCVNLYKRVEETKKTIHFKIWRNDEHIKECPLYQRKNVIREVKELNSNKKNRLNKDMGYELKLREEKQEKTKHTSNPSDPLSDTKSTDIKKSF